MAFVPSQARLAALRELILRGRGNLFEMDCGMETSNRSFDADVSAILYLSGGIATYRLQLSGNVH
jgi:hypothetical protein